MFTERLGYLEHTLKSLCDY